MDTITTLTDEQKARFPEFVERWTKIGLDTRPIDKDKAREAVRLLYKCGDQPLPKQILFFDSPAHMYRALAALQQKHQHILELTEEQAQETVEQMIKEGIGQANLNKVATAALSDTCYGAHDAGWLSLYSTVREVLNLKEQTEKLLGLFMLAEECGWVYPAEDVCLVSAKPVEIRRDEQGRLHSTRGPALRYSDGFGVYSFHGLRIPANLTHGFDDPSTITIQEVQEQNNAELRRALVSQMGEARYVQEIGAKPIHEDECGTLFRAEVPGDEPIVMLRGINSTEEPDGSRKVYWLRVAPDLRPLGVPNAEPQEMTARNAAASLAGLRGEDYEPIKET